VVTLGKGTTGEKTMLDALVPALDAARGAVEGGAGVRDVAVAARDAAATGAESTIPMLATKGRASYLGERSIGHQDPGATSSTILLAALVDALDGVAAE
jgi:dihydroxyacetone kinase-like protein